MPADMLSKLYLELANLLPASTKSSRELDYELQIKQALCDLDESGSHNGSVRRASERLKSIFGPDYVVMSNVDHHELLVRIQMAEQKMQRRCVHLCEQVAEQCRTDAKLSCYAEAIDLMIEELRKVEPE